MRTAAEPATTVEAQATCPAVDAVSVRIIAELTGNPGLSTDEPRGLEFAAGLWEALRVAAESRYTVAGSTKTGAAAAGWEVTDQWTGEVIAWESSRQAADDLAAEQGVLNAAEVKAALLAKLEQATTC